jgi:hypothetical protein
VLIVDIHGELIHAGIIEPGLNVIEEQVSDSLLGLFLGCPQDIDKFNHGPPPN